MSPQWKKPRVRRDTLAFIQYTSGSTAAPKGVMISHGNLLDNSAIIQQRFGHTPRSRGVIWLPPYHDMGLIGGVAQPLYAGFPVTLMSPVTFLLRPLRWLQAVSRTHATTSGGPNFAYDLCTRKITAAQRARLDLSAWEVAFNGAETVREDTLQRFVATFGACGFRPEAFYPCYGLAEATLLVTGGVKKSAPVVSKFHAIALQHNHVMPASQEQVAPSLVACGGPAPNFKVAIVEPERLQRRPPDQVGEIWVSGPSVALGYWNQPQETERTFRAYLAENGEGPFLRTGDLGFLHDGNLFITGRLKEIIIIGGRNHYPQDIEHTVEHSHLAVRPGGCAVFSVDSAGEERLVVMAEMEPHYRPQQLQPDGVSDAGSKHVLTTDAPEVMRAIRQAVAEHHELRVHHALLLRAGSIPKTSSGKIQRSTCRSRFLEGSVEVIHEVDYAPKI